MMNMKTMIGRGRKYFSVKNVFLVALLLFFIYLVARYFMRRGYEGMEDKDQANANANANANASEDKTAEDKAKDTTKDKAKVKANASEDKDKANAKVNASASEDAKTQPDDTKSPH